MSLLPSDPSIQPVFQHEAEVEPVSLEVFWPVSGGYDAKAVAGRLYHPRRWVRVALNVPPQERGAVLRVDPCSEFGILEIAQIRIAPVGRANEGVTFRPKDKPEGLKFDATCLSR